MAPLPRTLLLTRPREQSLAFATALERVLPGRFQALVAPMLAIAPTGAPIALDGIQALLFTSANGVAQFAAQSPERGLPALCVGAMTTEAARRAGFAATSAEGDVAALARLARDAWRPGGTFLHVRGRHAAGDLVAALGAWGCRHGQPRSTTRCHNRSMTPRAPPRCRRGGCARRVLAALGVAARRGAARGRLAARPCPRSGAQRSGGCGPRERAARGAGDRGEPHARRADRGARSTLTRTGATGLWLVPSKGFA